MKQEKYIGYVENEIADSISSFPHPGDPLLLGQEEHPGNDQDDGSTAYPISQLLDYYLSWDAASWHISQDLAMHVKQRNDEAEAEGYPVVKTAPLPAGAQFLNVIESVFSGMARGILHNSDYDSVEAAKDAIDRYYAERNEYFQAHPKRAGHKIWGQERVQSEFHESNNCKDPLYCW